MKNQKGIGLLEVAMALIVAAVFVAAAFYMYGTLNAKKDTHIVQSMVSEISKASFDVIEATGNAAAITEANLVASGLISAAYVSGGDIVTPLGDVLVRPVSTWCGGPAGCNGSFSNTDRFHIIIQGADEDACKNLAGGWVSSRQSWISIKKEGQNIHRTAQAPLSPSVVNQACSAQAPPLEIVYTFR